MSDSLIYWFHSGSPLVSDFYTSGYYRSCFSLELNSHPSLAIVLLLSSDPELVFVLNVV